MAGLELESAQGIWMITLLKESIPQVGKQLKIIASSPEVVPSVFAFGADYVPSFKETVFAAIRDLHKSPTGQQVLTIFHSEKMEEQPVSCLDSALELLTLHQQSCVLGQVIAQGGGAPAEKEAEGP